MNSGSWSRAESTPAQAAFGSPVAAYEEVCPTFIRVNTSGATSADLDSFRYAHRRKPLFPFEDAEWKR